VPGSIEGRVVDVVQTTAELRGRRAAPTCCTVAWECAGEGWLTHGAEEVGSSGEINLTDTGGGAGRSNWASGGPGGASSSGGCGSPLIWTRSTLAVANVGIGGGPSCRVTSTTGGGGAPGPTALTAA
jgi:hypothetical protein